MKENSVKFKDKISVRFGSIMCVVIVALCFAMALSVTKTIQTQFTGTVYSMSENIVGGRADEITNWIEIYKNDLKVYSGAEINKTGDDEKVISWLKTRTDLRNEDYDYMFYCASDGTSYRDTGLVGGKGALTDRDYYKALMLQNKDFFVGEMILSKTSGQYVIPIGRAAKNEAGKTFGFYIGMLGFQTLSNKLTEFQVGETGYFFLVDKTGRIISHPDSSKFLTNLDPQSELYKAVVSRTSANFDALNKTELYHYTVVPIQNTDWSLCMSIADKEVQASVLSSRKSMATWSVVMMILIIVILFVCINGILGKVKSVNKIIDSLSEGDADLTVQLKIKTQDEIGLLIASVNKFLSKFRSIMTTIKSSETNLEEAGGVLTGEIANTTTTIEQMSNNIRLVNGQVQEQAVTVDNSASALEEITKNIESLDKMIQSQASSVTQASAAVEQMIGNIGAVDKSVMKMSEEFESLEGDTKNGIEKNDSVNSLIQKIAEQSTSMADANTIIQNIAEQTNLLAMNAAIEAAHAGEAGKGFSVVADEIRKLAETSSEQSTKIGNELTNIQDGISQAVSASAESEKSFHSVSGRIASTGELIAQIRAAMDEQQAGSQQIMEALQAMNNSTSEVRGAGNEMNKGGQLIMADVQKLQESMNNIQSAVGEITNGTDYVNETTNKLKTISDALQKSIDDIGNDVNRFKV